MEIVITVVLVGLLSFTTWHIIGMRFLWPRRERRLMLDDLLTLDSPEEQRRYLHSHNHGRRMQRCACDEYVLPFPNGSVRDNEAMHSRYRCQPNREIIDAV